MDTPNAVQRALLPLAVLSALRRGPSHGYELVARLQEAGFDSAQGSTVYPLLRALEHNGWVTSHWDAPVSGPARKVVHVTAEGARRAERDHEAVGHVLSHLNQLDGRRQE